MLPFLLIQRSNLQHPTRSLQQYLAPWRAARPALTTWTFCTTGTPVVQNLQDWMISTAWKKPFRAGKMPCPRIGPEGSCWMGSWMDGWRWPKRMKYLGKNTYLSKGYFSRCCFYHFLMVRYVIWGHGKKSWMWFGWSRNLMLLMKRHWGNPRSE